MEPTIYKPSIYKGAGIYKNGAEGGGGDKFSNSPNMSIYDLQSDILYGKCSKVSGSDIAIFKIPAFEYNSYSTHERCIHYRIDQFGINNSAYSGDYFTNNSSIWVGMFIVYYPNSLEININGSVIDVFNDVSFDVGDDIIEKVYVDNVNQTIAFNIHKNNVLIKSKTYSSTPVSIGTRMFNVFSLRFDTSGNYGNIGTFIFSGSWIKANGSLLWGLED